MAPTVPARRGQPERSRDHPEVAATLFEDRPEEDQPEEDQPEENHPEGSRLELAAWTLVAHGRQREEP